MSDPERPAPRSTGSPPVGAQGWGRTFGALSVPQFRQLWVGSLLSFSAMQMTQVARPWLAFHVSESGLALGLVAAAQGLAMLVVSPFGGVAADRLPKRLVLLGSQFSLLLTAVVMVRIVFFDVVEVWHLVLIALVHGATVPFNQPVRQSYIPVLLPRSMLANGVALQGSGRNLNQVAAPSVVGVLLAIEPSIAFFFIVALHFGSMIVSLRLPHSALGKAESRGVAGEALYGLRYIWGSPMLRMLVGLALLAVLFGFPYQQLMPVFQIEVFDVGPSRLGFMYTCVGAGALTASLVVASFSGLATRGFPQLVAGVLFGLALVGFALPPAYLVALPLLFVTGFCAQSYATMNTTLMMMNSDPALYGRVASVNMMTRAFMPLIVLPFGIMSDAVGAPTTVATAGAVLAASILVVGLARPDLRRTRGVGR